LLIWLSGSLYDDDDDDDDDDTNDDDNNKLGRKISAVSGDDRENS